MGKVRKVSVVKLIAGMITAEVNNFPKTHETLRRKFGAIDYISPVFNFNLTDYYQQESTFWNPPTANSRKRFVRLACGAGETGLQTTRLRYACTH